MTQTTQAGVPGSRLTALLNTHIDSPLQHTYPGADGSDPELDSRVAHAKVFEEGVRGYGITLPASPGSRPLPVPGKWYGVGGAQDVNTKQRMPEIARPMSGNVGAQFNTNDALGQNLRVEGQNYDRAKKGMPKVYSGGWNEAVKDEHGNETGERRAVLDGSRSFRSLPRAMDAAKKAGERAVFDAKNVDEIDVKDWHEKNKS